MKMNRRQFLKMLGVIFTSPLLKACEMIFGAPVAPLTPAVPPTATTWPTQTGIPPPKTPTETPLPGVGGLHDQLLVFGKDPFRIDLIGAWLAGHEPGNFGSSTLPGSADSPMW